MGREDYILRAYRDFCVFHHFTPALPCAWTWEQAVAYRRGQRTRDRLDRAARLASKYFPQEKEPALPPSNEAIYERLLELERDIEGLLSHRHQALEASKPPQRSGVHERFKGEARHGGT